MKHNSHTEEHYLLANTPSFRSLSRNSLKNTTRVNMVRLCVFWATQTTQLHRRAKFLTFIPRQVGNLRRWVWRSKVTVARTSQEFYGNVFIRRSVKFAYICIKRPQPLYQAYVIHAARYMQNSVAVKFILCIPLNESNKMLYIYIRVCIFPYLFRFC